MADVASPEKITIRDEEGVVTEEVTMRDGVLDGETLLYSAGRLRARLQFRGGKKNGEALFYDDAGRVSTKAQYLDGKLHGESLHYNPSGILMRKASYRKDMLHGHAIDYYPSGKPREVSTHKDNVLDGEMIRLGKDGKITERLYYQGGRLRSAPPPQAKLAPPKAGGIRS
jgi:antitoxin component YwqK of YwqJK toxin-antitoxin module